MYKAGRIVAEWGIRAGRHQSVIEAINLMAEKKIDVTKWITHKLPESEAVEAMEMLIRKDEKSIGVEIIR